MHGERWKSTHSCFAKKINSITNIIELTLWLLRPAIMFTKPYRLKNGNAWYLQRLDHSEIGTIPNAMTKVTHTPHK